METDTGGRGGVPLMTPPAQGEKPWIRAVLYSYSIISLHLIYTERLLFPLQCSCSDKISIIFLLCVFFAP